VKRFYAAAQLEKRAKQLGANAVVKIVSYYKRVEMSSPTQFECHQGSRTTGVALKGDFVKLVEKKIAVYPYLHKEYE
jgi:uncharacterized protein YbjQ (UPF0145 family)